MKSIRIFLGIALAACFFSAFTAFSQAKSQQPEIVVEAPVIGTNAPQAKDLSSRPPSDVKGLLLYTFDTSTYGPGGVPWPFSSYFVLKQIGKAGSARTAALDLNQIRSFKVDPSRFEFIFQPKLSPNLQYVIFKAGDHTSSFSSFSLRLYDLRANKLTTMALGDAVGYWPVSWSPNSRYVAYFGGGFRFAFGTYVPVRLWAYDLQRQQSHLVSRSENLIGNIAWTPQNTLLYNLPAMRGTFEFDPATDRPAVFLHINAPHPAPSPDGKWIASIRQNTLSLFPRKREKIIRASFSGDPAKTALLWSADSRCLYRITRRHRSRSVIQAQFFAYSPSERSEKAIASFEYTNKDGQDDRNEEPIFSPLQVSRDGHFLFFAMIQNTGKTQNGRQLSDEYLKCLDLRTYRIQDICRIPASGLDWHDESEE